MICKSRISMGKPNVYLQKVEGSLCLVKIYGIRYAVKKPNPILGDKNAPNDPDSSVGENYLIIRGTRALQRPTLKP